MIKNRKGLINIKNVNDNECFRWCHLAYLYSANKDPQTIKKYRDYINNVNYERITFPDKIKDIPKIEEMNYIRLNVFGVSQDDKSNPIFPICISKKKCGQTRELHIIEGISDSDGLENPEEINTSHYVLIKDFNKLMHTQTKIRTS